MPRSDFRWHSLPQHGTTQTFRNEAGPPSGVVRAAQMDPKEPGWGRLVRPDRDLSIVSAGAAAGPRFEPTRDRSGYGAGLLEYAFTFADPPLRHGDGAAAAVPEDVRHLTPRVAQLAPQHIRREGAGGVVVAGTRPLAWDPPAAPRPPSLRPFPLPRAEPPWPGSLSAAGLAAPRPSSIAAARANRSSRSLALPAPPPTAAQGARPRPAASSGRSAAAAYSGRPDRDC